MQLQTLTAVVKLFLRKPDNQGLVQRVLNTATKDCDSPDVRDRAYIYWRLLSMDQGPAKVRRCPISTGDFIDAHCRPSYSHTAHRFRSPASPLLLPSWTSLLGRLAA